MSFVISTRFRNQRLMLLAGAACLVPGLAAAQAVSAADGSARNAQHVLYVESNVTASGKNAILAYDIAADGSLHPKPGSPFLTGGTGYYDGSFKLGPFDNDQNVILSKNKNILYAVNGGSNTIAAMRIGDDGSLFPLSYSPFSAHGSTPVSLGLHENTLIAVNSAEDPAQAASNPSPRLSVFDLLSGGYPLYAAAASVNLQPNSDPTQALTTNTGPLVFTAGFPAGGIVHSYFQIPDGRLIPSDAVTPPVENGTQALPLGLWANPRAPYLYVGFANTGQLGTYRYDPIGRLSLANVAKNSGQALCWIRTTRDGRYLYTANTGDASMSVYDLSDPAQPVEIQHAVVGGLGGLEEFSLSPDEQFLYVLEQENSAVAAGKSDKVHVLKVDHDTGLLTVLDDLTVTLPVPAQTRPIGLAIR